MKINKFLKRMTKRERVIYERYLILFTKAAQ